MTNFNFYYVSLSDGDGALRIRFIQSVTARGKQNTLTPNSFSRTLPLPSADISFDSLSFITDGPFVGNAYFNGNIMVDDASIFSITFDGTHSKKLLSDVGINPEKNGELIKVYDFDELLKIHSELKRNYPENADINTPEILSQITAKSYFYRALRCLETDYARSPSSSTRKLLVSAENYMRNNFQNGCTIEQLSKHLAIDRRYLYKLFKKYSGISPKQYLSNIKISYSCDLLQNTDLSVGDIAEKVGYDDLLQFSAFFKKQTGMSPLKWRARNM